MTDITLINPSFDTSRKKPEIQETKPGNMLENFPPMYLLYLAAYLRENGYDADVIDTRLYSEKEAMQKIEKINSPFVGLSVITEAMDSALRITKALKDHDKKIKTIWGGFHPTLYTDQCIDYQWTDSNGNKNSVDFVVSGEGEEKILDILKGTAADRLQVETRLFDLNQLPAPAFDLIPFEQYWEKNLYNGKRVKQLPVLSSRGCPKRCTFCVDPIVFKRRWPSMTAENFNRQMDELMQQYKGITHIFPYDENFFPDIKRAIAIADHFKELGVSWEANCSVDLIKRWPEGAMKQIADSGCYMFRMGIESGSDFVLQDVIHKDCSVQDNLDGVRKCNENGIVVMMLLMMGLPKETRQDIIKTVRMVYEMTTMLPISKKNVHVGPQPLRPYKGGLMYEMCDGIKDDEPRMLDEWVNYRPPYDKFIQPWIVDKKFAEDAVMMFELIQSKRGAYKNFADMAFSRLFSKFVDARIKTNFWGFTYDMKLAKAVRGIRKPKEIALGVTAE